jgi:hypothetical protein
MAIPQSRVDREQKKFMELNNEVAVRVAMFNQLVPEKYDSIDLGYTGSDLTLVQYFLDGSLVATLTLNYDAGNLSNVTRT